jgi:hypothetical protein
VTTIPYATLLAAAISFLGLGFISSGRPMPQEADLMPIDHEYLAPMIEAQMIAETVSPINSDSTQIYQFRGRKAWADACALLDIIVFRKSVLDQVHKGVFVSPLNKRYP